MAGVVVAAVVALLAVVLVTRGHDSKQHVQAATSSDRPTSSSAHTTTSTAAVAASSEATAAPADSNAPPTPPTDGPLSTEQPADDVNAPAPDPVPVPSTEPSPDATPLGPDGILYTRVADNSYQQVWAINPDGSGNTLLADGLDLWDVTWAPGHQQFAWTEGGVGPEGRRIHVRSVDGSSDRVLDPRDADGTLLIPFYDVQWSPDGSTIAYNCYHPTWDVTHVCTVDVATGEAHDLVDEFALASPDENGSPPSVNLVAWGPDSRLLSLTGPSSFRVVDRFTGEIWNVDGASRVSVFTADGEWVLSVDYRGLWKIPVHGGTSVQVPYVFSDALARSPDGEWFLARDHAPFMLFNLAGETRTVPGTEGADPQSW
jgi:hypothetical protein